MLRRLLSPHPTMRPDELADRLRSALAPRIIDVREPDEFATGHIPGAVNVPLSRFQALYPSLDRTAELVLVCRSGNRSGQAQRFLIQAGYSNTYNLVRGMLGWRGPTEV